MSPPGVPAPRPLGNGGGGLAPAAEQRIATSARPDFGLADLPALAQARLDPAVWAYLAGGAADELTLADNITAWQRQRLAPRVLRALAGGHCRTQLLGRGLALPVLMAPVAAQGLFHPDGERGSALAAAMQGAGYVMSTQAGTRLEDVAAPVRDEPGRGPLWFQLYLQPDRGATLDLVRRAEDAGFDALVLTVDASTQGVRDREWRAGFRLPPGSASANLGTAVPAPPRLQPPGGSALFDGLLQHAPTWDDLAWLQGQTRLPLLAKGLLHPADAVQAASLGVAGLVVSNHGGRTLDTTPATADALPRIAAALAARPGSAPLLLVDGGIRRGTDVFKALAMGADAVLVGRPLVMALAAAGAPGVARALRLLRDELEATMALAGCATVADIGPDRLWPP